MEPHDDECRFLRQVIHEMADTLGQTDNALAHFTCSEADTIVRVVALAGFPKEAADLVVCHARGEDVGEGDQEGDLHEEVALAYWVEVTGGWSRAHQLASEYVADL